MVNNCRKLEHPLYVFFGFIDINYDFSLLRLETPVDLNRFPNVRPVCWPSVDPGVGQQVTSSGKQRKSAQDLHLGSRSENLSH